MTNHAASQLRLFTPTSVSSSTNFSTRQTPTIAHYVFAPLSSVSPPFQLFSENNDAVLTTSHARLKRVQESRYSPPQCLPATNKGYPPLPEFEASSSFSHPEHLSSRSTRHLGPVRPTGKCSGTTRGGRKGSNKEVATLAWHICTFHERRSVWHTVEQPSPAHNPMATPEPPLPPARPRHKDHGSWRLLAPVTRAPGLTSATRCSPSALRSSLEQRVSQATFSCACG